ncbi:hypothetical protein CPJCM30710_24530 [Clostridium polyendosporum]|uniref:Uncharacterized protein n=1 Tax=Clostridium polyendosporum TaxID=69208 RepID=A0A919S0C3_9CLOT|nr:hypothetical protein [Clostridium polyendosporum]GIM29787.1 hypothetical protein CPJCM30710_24530 [Clostridium polyendosporum]
MRDLGGNQIANERDGLGLNKDKQLQSLINLVMKLYIYKYKVLYLGGDIYVY